MTLCVNVSSGEIKRARKGSQNFSKLSNYVRHPWQNDATWLVFVDLQRSEGQPSIPFELGMNLSPQNSIVSEPIRSQLRRGDGPKIVDQSRSQNRRFLGREIDSDSHCDRRPPRKRSVPIDPG